MAALKQVDNWETVNSKGYLSEIKSEELKKLQLFKDKYSNVRGDELVREVYRKFPYYAINSKTADRLMSNSELLAIEKAKPALSGDAFFTIGYEGQSFENYLNRLIKNNVKVLCDIRKNPLSRKFGFSKKTLSETLRKLEIDYIHIPELGIASSKRQELNSHADYNRLFNDYESSTLRENTRALDCLYNILQKYNRVAITCFEADHGMCHRSRVAKVLEKMPDWKSEIIHI